MDESLRTAIQQMKNGEERGFNEVYSKTYNRVYFRAKMLMGNEDDAQDLTQIVFIEAYKNIGSLEASEALYSWLDGIAYRQGMKVFRKKRDVLLAEDAEVVFDMLESNDISSMPELTADQKAAGEIIKEIIEELPGLQRTAVIMYYYDGMKLEQIADCMECSVNTIKSRLNYARKYIRSRVEETERKQGIRLHTLGLPVLWFSIRLLVKETTLTIRAAQAVFNGACKTIGLQAAVIGNAADAATEGKTFLEAGSESVSDAEPGIEPAPEREPEMKTTEPGDGPGELSAEPGEGPAEPESEPGGPAEPGSEPGESTEPGAEPGSEPGESAEAGTEPGSESGESTEPEAEPGSESGEPTEPGTEPGEGPAEPAESGPSEPTGATGEAGTTAGTEASGMAGEAGTAAGAGAGAAGTAGAAGATGAAAATIPATLLIAAAVVVIGAGGAYVVTHNSGSEEAVYEETAEDLSQTEEIIEESAAEEIVEEAPEAEKSIRELTEAEQVQLAGLVGTLSRNGYGAGGWRQEEPSSMDADECLTLICDYYNAVTLSGHPDESCLPYDWFHKNVAQDEFRDFAEYVLAVQIPDDYSYRSDSDGLYWSIADGRLEWEYDPQFTTVIGRTVEIVEQDEETAAAAGTYWVLDDAGELREYSFTLDCAYSGNTDLFGGLQIRAMSVTEGDVLPIEMMLPDDIDYHIMAEGCMEIIQSVMEQGMFYGEYDGYYIYDVDRDGIPEFIIQVGTCDADCQYAVYRFDGTGMTEAGRTSIGGELYQALGEEESGVYVRYRKSYYEFDMKYQLSSESGLEETLIFEGPYALDENTGEFVGGIEFTGEYYWPIYGYTGYDADSIYECIIANVLY